MADQLLADGCLMVGSQWLLPVRWELLDEASLVGLQNNEIRKNFYHSGSIMDKRGLYQQRTAPSYLVK